MNTKEVKLGYEPFIHEHVTLKNVQFGQYNEIGPYNYFENVALGDYSYTGQFCFIQNTVIGKFSNIAAMVRIGPTDHPYERPSLHHFTYRRRMFGFSEEDDEEFFEQRVSRKALIGHDTWIGHGAIIHPEVTIGNGAVIGSGAVVTKDVPPYAIAVGVPAKIIKYRFPSEVIDKLQSIQWWNWPYEKIKEQVDDFHLHVEQFIKKHSER
ncbi:chloramphenicol acetyltransferase [Siminovitchia sp. FSL H7-0308]|uniref:Phosphonate metabolism protein (Transferase hexapeptide repeat family) n=1 Tax=Siminovitchia thermophila TaxID=1245522 RepID=A0ABS2RBE5_9BACI|nr:chloramphenicol acetyltransferase [Siminovitchia thermophila]MBM7715921.1 phosphonate metabolism protein (transferase hexapeptide repeat family) [Siminovitchia thermophila]ONK21555.1 chloramphenicol acetyltransferase [Bacillus sp. VT-16-64]